MGLKLKKIQRINPQHRNQSKWYLTQNISGSVKTKDIAEEIVKRSALSLGDVQSTLSNLVEIIPLFMKLGQSIRLEGLGSFHISVTSEGVHTAEELTIHQIKNAKIVFVPGIELKKSLEGISFEVES